MYTLPYIGAYARTHTSIFAYIYVHRDVWMCVCESVRGCLYERVYMFAYVQMNIPPLCTLSPVHWCCSIHTCAYSSVYMYTYTCVHTHSQIFGHTRRITKQAYHVNTFRQIHLLTYVHIQVPYMHIHSVRRRAYPNAVGHTTLTVSKNSASYREGMGAAALMENSLEHVGHPCQS